MCLKNLYTKRGLYKFQKHKARWGGNCLTVLDKIKNLYPKWIRSENRVSEELWMEVRDIVQEAVIKTIPKKKKCKKAIWLSEEALQIAVKRREVKGEDFGFILTLEENQWRFESWVGHSLVHLLQEVPLPPNTVSVAFLGALRVPSSLSNLTSQ